MADEERIPNLLQAVTEAEADWTAVGTYVVLSPAPEGFRIIAAGNPAEWMALLRAAHLAMFAQFHDAATCPVCLARAAAGESPSPSLH